jgi:TNF receptor-associated factor 2/TNF receptor-associated factor 3
MESTTPNNELEQQTSEKLSDLADKVQKLNDETVELSRNFVKLNELSQVAVQELDHFKNAANERNSIMSSLQPKQETIQKEIEQLKQNLEENQHVSVDGTLTWRVDRVAERMADAQSERQPSIYSPIFYSSPTGYKMRARLYLHGDGNARRTHMSLFFLLMRGDYDALLPWPFGYKVTFCLFDQTGNNRHIIDSFRPDTKSNSFQRPKTEANIASGIPKFFPLPMIQQDDNPYVREDTLFLKIVVDLNETPKMILPYMLTLNPGLPNHVQQILINQEKVKRQQQQNATGLAASQGVPTNTCG